MSNPPTRQLAAAAGAVGGFDLPTFSLVAPLLAFAAEFACTNPTSQARAGTNKEALSTLSSGIRSFCQKECFNDKVVRSSRSTGGCRGLVGRPARHLDVPRRPIQRSPYDRR